jgi:hypothetical protein
LLRDRNVLYRSIPRSTRNCGKAIETTGRYRSRGVRISRVVEMWLTC